MKVNFYRNKFSIIYIFEVILLLYQAIKPNSLLIRSKLQYSLGRAAYSTSKIYELATISTNSNSNYNSSTLHGLKCTMLTTEYIRSLYNSSTKNIFSLLVTGGGVSSVQNLLTVPGASNSVISAHVPYARAALLNSIAGVANSNSGKLPPFCSSEMAIVMAKAAFKDAVENIVHDSPSTLLPSKIDLHSKVNIFGVACTAALVSDSPKKGEHRCHVAIYAPSRTTVYSLVLDKGARNRVEEDHLCSQLLLSAIGLQCGKQTLLPLDSLLNAASVNDKSSDALHIENKGAESLLGDVCNGIKTHVTYFPNPGTPVSSWNCASEIKFPAKSIVFPGSFNPLHEGHINLARAAVEMVRHESSADESPILIFEISALNADKPAIPVETLLSRVQQFDIAQNSKLQALTDAGIPFAVTITSQPLFTKKATIFPSCNFILGADTLTRLFDLKYYRSASTSLVAQHERSDDGMIGLVKALGSIAEQQCKFVIGGRLAEKKDENGNIIFSEFQTMETIFKENIAAQTIFSLWPGLFTGLSEEDFRVDLSSTTIRNRECKG